MKETHDYGSIDDKSNGECDPESGLILVSEWATAFFTNLSLLMLYDDMAHLTVVTLQVRFL